MVLGPEVWGGDAAGYRLGTRLAVLADPDITESSGLAASIQQPGILWTHNDSGEGLDAGEGARLYATDRAGRALASLAVPGAINRDWEDLALGPGADGTTASALYIADTGDNGASRDDAALYRVPEPTVDPTRTGRRGESAPAERFPLVYPDGAPDVETLLVHPTTGEVLLLAKDGSGGSALYRAPGPLVADQPVALERLGTIEIDGLIAPSRLATGGTVAPDGARVVIRTYVAAHEWDIAPGATLAATLLDGASRRVVLPIMAQGEAIAYAATGGALLVTSEGSPAPLYELVPRGS
jgi:hypothetical protein